MPQLLFTKPQLSPVICVSPLPKYLPLDWRCVFAPFPFIKYLLLIVMLLSSWFCVVGIDEWLFGWGDGFCGGFGFVWLGFRLTHWGSPLWFRAKWLRWWKTVIVIYLWGVRDFVDCFCSNFKAQCFISVSLYLDDIYVTPHWHMTNALPSLTDYSDSAHYSSSQSRGFPKTHRSILLNWSCSRTLTIIIKKAHWLVEMTRSSGSG